MIKLMGLILSSPAGSFGFILCTMLLVFWIIIKVNTEVTISKNDKSHFTDSIKDLKQSQQTIITTISEIVGCTKYISESISDIKNELKELKRVKSDLAMHSSPLQLTDKGKTVKNLINLDQLLANHWGTIQTKILEQIQDKDNPYDIQQMCFTYFENLELVLTPEELNNIKLVAYNRGESIDDYYIVFGLETRDKIFTHLNIALGTIDEYTPKK